MRIFKGDISMSSRDNRLGERRKNRSEFKKMREKGRIAAAASPVKRPIEIPHGQSEKLAPVHK
jgi:hypothetical protein